MIMIKHNNNTMNNNNNTNSNSNTTTTPILQSRRKLPTSTLLQQPARYQPHFHNTNTPKISFRFPLSTNHRRRRRPSSSSPTSLQFHCFLSVCMHSHIPSFHYILNTFINNATIPCTPTVLSQTWHWCSIDDGLQCASPRFPYSNERNTFACITYMLSQLCLQFQMILSWNV